VHGQAYETTFFDVAAECATPLQEWLTKQASIFYEQYVKDEKSSWNFLDEDLDIVFMSALHFRAFGIPLQVP
jgi:hypothetical protein